MKKRWRNCLIWRRDTDGGVLRSAFLGQRRQRAAATELSDGRHANRYAASVAAGEKRGRAALAPAVQDANSCAAGVPMKHIYLRENSR